MPFAEVASGVPSGLQYLRKRHLFGPQIVTPGETGEAVGMATGENAAASGRADGSGGIEAIEAEIGRRHCVEDGSFNVGIAVVGDVAVTLVIGHEEDDVGARLGGH